MYVPGQGSSALRSAYHSLLEHALPICLDYGMEVLHAAVHWRCT
jgi:hypothetical protein